MPEGFSDQAESVVHEVLDGILPEGLEWDELVRAYPVPVLLVVALGGFLLGRKHGPAIVSAVSTFAAAEVARNVSSLIGEELEP